MKYTALRHITGAELITKGTEELTAEQLGGEDSVKRLLDRGAIEVTGKKKEAEPVIDPKTEAANGGKGKTRGKKEE